MNDEYNNIYFHLIQNTVMQWPLLFPHQFIPSKSSLARIPPIQRSSHFLHFPNSIMIWRFKFIDDYQCIFCLLSALADESKDFSKEMTSAIPSPTTIIIQKHLSILKMIQKMGIGLKNQTEMQLEVPFRADKEYMMQIIGNKHH